MTCAYVRKPTLLYSTSNSSGMRAEQQMMLRFESQHGFEF